MSFDEWVDSLKVTAVTKRLMRVIWNAMGRVLVKRMRARKKAGFSKTERYPQYKHFRGIHACSMEEKLFCGPAIKSMEAEVYSQLSDNFLKGVVSSSKATELYRRLYAVGAQFLGLDVKNWEGSVLSHLRRVCELALYKRMLSGVAPEVVHYIEEEFKRPHTIMYHDFMLQVDGGRMSGDLWTSIGNGFTNLMLVKFVCSKYGYDPVGVVEGDDGLFRLDGPTPTQLDFARLGFNSKIEVFDSIGAAGFCKMKFDSDLVQVTDCGERLVKFGWTTAIHANEKTRLSLLYTKALSLKAEFPSCPILGPFADYVIRCCKKLHPAPLPLSFDEDRGWTAHKIECARWLDQPAKISMTTRLFYESTYGYSPRTQLAIEASFQGNELLPITNPLLLDRLPPVWADNFHNFVYDVETVDW